MPGLVSLVSLSFGSRAEVRPAVRGVAEEQSQEC